MHNSQRPHVMPVGERADQLMQSVVTQLPTEGQAQALRRPPPTTEHLSELGSSHNTAFHRGAKQIPDMPNHFTERGSVHHD